jgi:hypothetical protein
VTIEIEKNEGAAINDAQRSRTEGVHNTAKTERQSFLTRAVEAAKAESLGDKGSPHVNTLKRLGGVEGIDLANAPDLDGVLEILLGPGDHSKRVAEWRKDNILPALRAEPLDDDDDREVDDTDADQSYDHPQEPASAATGEQSPPSASGGNNGTGQAKPDSIKAKMPKGRPPPDAAAAARLAMLPEALQPLSSYTNWVVWRGVAKGNDKIDKVPYQTDGTPASTSNQATWTSYVAVSVARNRYDGIGFVLKNSNIVAFDVDDCRNPVTGELHPWAKALVEKANSYAEVTPSKTGIRIIGRGDGEKVHTSLPVHDGVVVEIYRKATRYITITGDVLHDAPLVNIDKIIDEVQGELAQKKKARGRPKTNKPLHFVNATAMGDLDSWVPKLFANAERSEAGWRVTSAALGRDLQEDLSITPDGIKDFGLHDQNDPREGKRTPVELVAEWHLKVPIAKQAEAAINEAAQWLWEALGRAGDWRGANFSVEDFYAYLPDHNYIFVPTREFWPAPSVNGVLTGTGGKPSEYLDRHRSVVQATWAPGKPVIIKDHVVAEGGWIARPGTQIFNLYRPPQLELGDASQAGPWIDHLRLIYPDTAEEQMNYYAHCVQRPWEKINHALVLGGSPGIGKDTLLEPVKYAVGHWNFGETAPADLFGEFNPQVRNVVLRINEARDMGDVNRFAFYEHVKIYEAAPPDVLSVNDKYIRRHYIANIVRLIYTTNNKTTGLYLPGDDRRHLVDWSEKVKEDFDDKVYWNTIWGWYYDKGGLGHVAAFLMQRDLSGFNPKAAPQKTAAFWAIVDANRSEEEGELSDALDNLTEKSSPGVEPSPETWPDAVTVSDVRQFADTGLAEWLRDRRNSRRIPHHMEKVGYVSVRNDGAKDGAWKMKKDDARHMIYVKKTLSLAQQLAAARTLAATPPTAAELERREQLRLMFGDGT